VTTLVVQMATGTFSARYMRLWYRDRQIMHRLRALFEELHGEVRPEYRAAVTVTHTR
jgi:hypothetical protein